MLGIGLPSVSWAQPIPDTTLGPENSVITPIDAMTDRVDGGARREANLFHSFQDFNIDLDRTVNFANPIGVERIFSRVTGDNASNILGTLGVLGGADLFFINPNGIIFGPDFRFNVNGSLVFSTADAIGFETNGLFSARFPESSALLSVNPNALFFNARPDNTAPGSIVVDSRSNRNATRSVGEGETLGMVGGEVDLMGGRLRASDGRIEVGGVGEGSTIDLIPLNQGYDIEYGRVENFENVTLGNRGRLIVNGTRGGNIHMQGEQVRVRGNARVVGHTTGNPDVNGPRTVLLRASDLIAVNDGEVRAIVTPSSTSNQRGADIVIESDRLLLRNGGDIATSVEGIGDGGDVIVRSPTIRLENDPDTPRSNISAFIDELARGIGGDILIEAERFDVTSGSRVFTTLEGEGTSGNLTIRASEQMEVRDPRTVVATDIVGRGVGGSLDIQTPRLLITDEGKISTSIVRDGTGIAGDMRIVADEVIISNPGEPDFTGIFTQVNRNAADEFSEAGDLLMIVDRLEMRDGALISSSLGNRGIAGDITIRARQIEVSGVMLRDGEDLVVTTINADVGRDGNGDAGTIDIETDQLTLRDGGQIRSQTRGPGTPGDVVIRANDIRISGEGVPGGDEPDESGISVLTTSSSDAGEIIIESNSLRLQDRAAIAAQARRPDNGDETADTPEPLITGSPGQIQINSNTITLESSTISTAVREGVTVQTPSDQTGQIIITADSLVLRDRSEIGASTLADGDAGNVDIMVQDDIRLSGRSAISSEVGPEGMGRGGTIQVRGDRLLLTSGSRISSSTENVGDAGDISLAIADRVVVNGQGTGVFANVSPDATGTGGSITAATARFELSGGGQLSASTQGDGRAGDINLQIDDQLSARDPNTGIFARTESDRRGGDITIRTPNVIRLQEGATLSASTSGLGAGGNVQLDSARIALSESARISASTTAAGAGGSITLNSPHITLDTGSAITASTTASGAGGRITIESPGANPEFNDANSRVASGSNSGEGHTRLALDNGSIISASTQGDGEGGRVTVRSDRVSLANQSRITASTSGAGDGGPIRVEGDRLSLTSGAVIEANTIARGDAGNIRLVMQEQIVATGPETRISTSTARDSEGAGGSIALLTDTLSLDNEAAVSASTRGQGSGGRIRVEGATQVSLNNGAIITARTGGMGPGGSIRVNDTTHLQLDHGAAISASSAGLGDGGDINVNSDRVTLDHDARITARTGSAGDGEGGNITLVTDELSLDHGATISASTRSEGPGGRVAIRSDRSPLEVTLDHGAEISANTTSLSPRGRGGQVDIEGNRLALAGGARIIANTRGQGNAGDVRLFIDDEILLTGVDTGIFASTEANSTGNGGDIDIDPRVVRIEDGARIAASSEGSGEGGNVALQAGRLFLVNGVISTETRTERGGDIDLQIGDLLVLSENSSIAATAGQAQGAGNGGNITITLDDGYAVALDQQNNDIVANAFAGDGGRIDITATQIINLVPRPSQPENQTNDIDASSAFGSSGAVTINGIDIDPSRGLTELPTQIVDAAQLVAQECAAGAMAQPQSEFTIVGQGGIVPAPGNVLSQAIWDDTRRPDRASPHTPFPEQSMTEPVLPEQPIPEQSVPEQSRMRSVPSSSPHFSNTEEISRRPTVEVQDWMVDGAGNIVLLEDLTTMLPRAVDGWRPHLSCGLR